jgi:predicted acyltransferase (DUF342 family)
MRKVLISCIGLCFVLGLVAVGHAMTTTPSAKMTGTLTAVNAVANSFTMKLHHGEKDFTLGENAKINSAGKTISLADLKAGERVQVTYSVSAGKMVASEVELLSSSAASMTPKPSSH